MSNPFSLPSYLTSPFVTTIPGSRYDSRGRQLNFEESNVQRRERLAFANASKSAGTSPIQSPSSSSSGSPIVCSPSPSPMNGTHQTLRQQTRRTLISEPFSDPIEHMANQLALELFDVDDFLSFDLDFELPPATTQHHGRPYNAASSPTTTTTPQFFSSSKTSSSSFRKKKNTLSLIPEED
jgi:hypothetical protein